MSDLESKQGRSNARQIVAGLVALWSVAAGCVGDKGTIAVREAAMQQPQATAAPQLAVAPAPSIAEGPAVNLGCDIIAQGLPLERCFASLTAACDALGCPSDRCDLVYSFPAMAVCR